MFRYIFSPVGKLLAVMTDFAGAGLMTIMGSAGMLLAIPAMIFVGYVFFLNPGNNIFTALKEGNEQYIREAREAPVKAAQFRVESTKSSERSEPKATAALYRELSKMEEPDRERFIDKAFATRIVKAYLAARNPRWKISRVYGSNKSGHDYCFEIVKKGTSGRRKKDRGEPIFIPHIASPRAIKTFVDGK